MSSHPNKLVDGLDRSFLSIAEWAIKSRPMICLFALIIIISSFYLASLTRYDNSLDSFFHKNDPIYIQYKEFLDDFISDEVIYIMYSANQYEHGPFNIDVMKKIAKLTDVIETEVPFTHRATSLSNVEFMRVIGENDIEIDELLINFSQTQQDLLKIRELIQTKSRSFNYLISEDLNYAAIIIEMERSTTDELDDVIFNPEIGTKAENIYPFVSDIKITEILNRPEFANQGIDFYVSGDVPMNNTYRVIMIGDMIKITMASMLLIMFACLIFLPISTTNFFGPICVVLISSLSSIALIGILDWEMTQFTSLLPTLLCAVGVAQSVHILFAYNRHLGLSNDRNLSAKQALIDVGAPCLLATITTACGLAVMVISDMRMLSEFAIYSSFGIIFTYLLSMTLLVVFLSCKSDKSKILDKRASKPAIGYPLVTKIIESSISIINNKPNAVIFISTALFIISIAGITQLRNDFNFLHEFKPHIEWRIATEKVEENLAGTVLTSFVIDTGKENGIKNPAILRYMDDMQTFLEKQDIVKNTISLADIIKDLNETFNGGDKSFFKIPSEQDLLSQYFLVYELSGGQDLEQFTSHDFSKAVIDIQLKMSYTSELRTFNQKLDTYIKENPLPSAKVEGFITGIGLLWVALADYVTETQIQSYTLVFIMIALLMWIAFGRLKIALLAMIPNLTPIILVLGALGLTNTPIDYMKLILATVSIGIAVDDTIHFMTRFRSNFYLTGSYKLATEQSLRTVGPALITTTIILVCAFSMYSLSGTEILASFSLLLAGIITVALITDLLLMPVILNKLKPFGEEFTPVAG